MSQLSEDLQNGSHDDKAKAGYMAVCLDLAKTFPAKYRKRWNEACYLLSGYWKSMSNLD